MSLSRSVSPPRPARNPLRLPPNSNAVSHGRGILGRKNSGSSKSSSTRSIATGLVASVASWQAESRTTLSNSDSNPLAAGETSFDQLLLSDATIKLSFTPDTLRDPVPATPLPSTDPSASNPPSPGRLRPRPPRPRGPLVAIRDETAEESDVSTADESKAALIEMIKSVPPWLADPNDSAEPTVPRPGLQHVGAARTRKRNPPLSYVSCSRQVLLEAKEGARDLASERQVNQDLVDFFATAPPPISSGTGAHNGSTLSLTHERSKSAPTLQKLVARVTTSSTKTDKRLMTSSNTSRASRGFASSSGEERDPCSHPPTASFLPTSSDKLSLSAHQANYDASTRRRESGCVLPAGLVEPYAPGTALPPEERLIRTSTRPRAGDRRGSAPSILHPQRSSARTDLVENPDLGAYDDGGSAVGPSSSPTSTFQTAPRSPRSSQRSRSDSTSSLMSSSAFPSPPHQRSPRRRTVLVPPMAIGSALAVESSAAPVTFQHRRRAQDSVSSSGNERRKQLEVDTGASAPASASSTAPPSTEIMQTLSTALLSPSLLLQLRSSMTNAKTRDDCILLIDEALRRTAASSGPSLTHVAEHICESDERGRR